MILILSTCKLEIWNFKWLFATFVHVVGIFEQSSHLHILVFFLTFLYISVSVFALPFLLVNSHLYFWHTYILA